MYSCGALGHVLSRALKAQVRGGRFTFANIETDNFKGEIKMYTGEGGFIDESVDTVGSPAVCKIQSISAAATAANNASRVVVHCSLYNAKAIYYHPEPSGEGFFFFNSIFCHPEPSGEGSFYLLQSKCRKRRLSVFQPVFHTY